MWHKCSVALSRSGDGRLHLTEKQKQLVSDHPLNPTLTFIFSWQTQWELTCTVTTKANNTTNKTKNNPGTDFSRELQFGSASVTGCAAVTTGSDVWLTRFHTSLSCHTSKSLPSLYCEFDKNSCFLNCQTKTKFSQVWSGLLILF